LLPLIFPVDIAQKALKVSLVFGTRFMLGFLEGCITNEYLALFAPESGLDYCCQLMLDFPHVKITSRKSPKQNEGHLQLISSILP
jgi:hypothetical protein